MSENTKRSSFTFKEGHKRETRKSYQAYVEEIMEKKNATSSSCEETASDDSSVRRSKRTPVPKRGFKLIDDYEAKKEPTKKKLKTENGFSKDKETSPDSKKEIIQEKEESEPLKDEDKEEEKDDNTPSRRSGRARKPKNFEDSIHLPYIKKPQITKEPETPIDLKQEKEVTNEKKKLLGKGDTKKNISKEEPIETPKSKRKGRKSTEDVAEHPKSNEKNKTPSKANVSETVKDKKKRKSEDKSAVDTKEASPVKSPSKRKRNNQENVSIKEEVESSDSSQLNISQESDVSPKKTYESYVTTGSKKYSPCKGRHRKQSDEAIILTLKSPVVEAAETPKLKAKGKVEAKLMKRKEEINEEVETKKKSKKAKISEKREKKSKKTSHKLVVSFKKKDKKDLDKKKKKKTTEKEKKVAVEKDLSKNDEVVKELKEELLVKEEKVKEKQKKKNKKKNKKKLENKNHKVINVQTFPVNNQNIQKVKKKKIYKKRNGEKVLVRIIKNHCNKNGEIVKTETVLVDSLENENKNNKNKTEDIVLEAKNEGDNNLATDVSPSMETEQTVKIEIIETQKPEVLTKTEPDIPSDIDPEFVPTETKCPEFIKKPVAKKKPVTKKSTKIIKKSSARPANKNVTVGGKVVGKTTKGMKKTGLAVLDEAPVTPKFNDTHESSDIPTEPKNAYNLFCRKYRPLVVKQNPKADFAEISRRLAALWNMASDKEKQEHKDRMEEIQPSRSKLLVKINRTSPSTWTESEFKYVKKVIGENVPFTIPTYSVKRLQPVDMAAHLQLLGESLNVIGAALQQQSTMTVHGALSVLLDSILCAIAPLIFMTSHIPEMNAIEEDTQARTLDNLAYILPGL